MDIFNKDPVREFVNSLFDLDGAVAPLLPLLAIYNKTVFSVGALIIFAVAATWAFRASYTGRAAAGFTGMGFVRFVVAASMIIPTPSGALSSQVALGHALRAGLDGAAEIYAKADKLVRRQGRALTLPADPQAPSLALDISAFLICDSYADAVFASLKRSGLFDYPASLPLLRVASENDVRFVHKLQWTDTAVAGPCGQITVTLTGDGAAHRAAFEARIAAVEELVAASSGILDTAIGNFAISDHNVPVDQVREAAAAAIERMQDAAFNALTRAQVEQAARARAAVDQTAAKDWDGAFWSVGADLVSLHRAQLDIMRASLPGSVDVQPADLVGTLGRHFGGADFERDLLSLDALSKSRTGRPVFDTAAEAEAVGRHPPVSWLKNTGKMLGAGLLPAVWGKPLADEARGELKDAGRAKLLLAAKELFVAVMQQPAADVIASPFTALAGMGAPLSTAGAYLLGGGAAASFVPGAGGVSSAASVGGIFLVAIGSAIENLSPLIPALLWFGVVATFMCAAVVALVVLPIIILMFLWPTGDEFFGDRLSLLKPITFICCLPVVATLGLLALTFVLGCVLATGNWIIGRAVGNEVAAGGGDAIAWLWWSAAYVCAVVIGGSIFAFKLTTGLAEQVADILGVAMPLRSGDAGNTFVGGAISKTTNVTQQGAGIAGGGAGGVASAAADAVRGAAGGASVKGEHDYRASPSVSRSDMAVAIKPVDEEEK